MQVPLDPPQFSRRGADDQSHQPGFQSGEVLRD